MDPRQNQNHMAPQGISPPRIDFYNFSPNSYGANGGSVNGQKNAFAGGSLGPGGLNKPPTYTIPTVAFTPSPNSLTPMQTNSPMTQTLGIPSPNMLPNDAQSRQLQQQFLQRQHAMHQINHQNIVNNPIAMKANGNNNAFSMGKSSSPVSSGNLKGTISPNNVSSKVKQENNATINRKLGVKSSANAADEDENPNDNRRKWTPLEDKKLKHAVKIFSEKNWKAIAEEVPGRNHVQCLQRWKKVLKPGLVKGHWTEEEDEKLRKVVKLGFKNWGEVAQKIKGRTAKQCRERWSCNLDPTISRDKWTAEEDRILLEAQERIGNKWSKIGKFLPGRTENAIKTRAKSLARAKLKAWTKEEDKIIIEAKTAFGSTNTRASAWSKIAEMLPNRSKNAVKKRWKDIKAGVPLGGAAVEKANTLKRANESDDSSEEGDEDGKEYNTNAAKRSKPSAKMDIDSKNTGDASLANEVKDQEKRAPSNQTTTSGSTLPLMNELKKEKENENANLLQQQQQQQQQQIQFQQTQQQQHPNINLGSYQNSGNMFQVPQLPQFHQQQRNMNPQMMQHMSGTTPPMIGQMGTTPSPTQYMIASSLASQFSSLGVSRSFLLPNSAGSGGQLSSPIAAASGNFGNNMNTGDYYGSTPPTTVMKHSFDTK